MSKKIIITGGMGFIGSQLANHLAKLGIKVFVVDKEMNDIRGYISENTIEVIKSDVCDVKQYERLLNEVDIVVHLAAAGNVAQSIANPIENFQNNVISTISLLEAMRVSRCNRIIFSSTGGALMGNAPPPISELSIPDPLSPYGASKLACEGYIRAYCESYKLVHTIFRFSNVIGPNCAHKQGVVQKFFQAIVNNADIEIFGEVSRDFIFSSDIVRIISDCILYDFPPNETLLLASGKETTIVDLAKKILTYFPESTSNIIQKERRVGEVGKVYGNIDKFDTFYPRFEFSGIDRALQVTLDYLVKLENG